MLVKEVMQKPIFISPKESLQNAAKRMTQSKHSVLLIGTENKVEGIITKEELIQHFGHVELVSEIMIKSRTQLHIDDSTEIALQIMKKNASSSAPVFSKDKVVGIASQEDLVGKDEDDDDFLLG